MIENLADIQQELATSSSPGEEFKTLLWTRQREVFFQLPESIQQSVIEDLADRQLHGFVRRLDPAEATDVLAFADAESQGPFFADLTTIAGRKSSSFLNSIS